MNLGSRSMNAVDPMTDGCLGSWTMSRLYRFKDKEGTLLVISVQMEGEEPSMLILFNGSKTFSTIPRSWTNLTSHKGLALIYQQGSAWILCLC